MCCVNHVHVSSRRYQHACLCARYRACWQQTSPRAVCGHLASDRVGISEGQRGFNTTASVSHPTYLTKVCCLGVGIDYYPHGKHTQSVASVCVDPLIAASRTHTRTHARTRARAHAHAHTRTRAHTHARTRTHTRARTHTHTHTALVIGGKHIIT